MTNPRVKAKRMACPVISGSSWLFLFVALAGFSPKGLGVESISMPLGSVDATTWIRLAKANVNSSAAHAAKLLQNALERYPTALLRADLLDEEPAASARYLSAQRYIEGFLLSGPKKVLVEYRKRVDPMAFPIFERARKQLDKRRLRAFIDRYYLSSWGDDAMELLGDLAFSDADFPTALYAYLRLLPPVAGTQPKLVHPGSNLSAPLLLAKSILAATAAGDPVFARSQLDALRRYFPDFTVESGHPPLAGRRGNLFSIVQTAIKEDHLSPGILQSRQWLTLGGNSARNNIRESLGRSLTLHREIPFVRRPDAAIVLAPDFFPSIMNHQIWMNDGGAIKSFELEDLSESPDFSTNVDLKTYPVSQDFTLSKLSLSFSDSAMVAVTQVMINPYKNNRADNSNSLIAFPPGDPGHSHWELGALDVIRAIDHSPDGQTASAGHFGEAPIVEGNRIYATLVQRFPRFKLYAVCVNVETGKIIWANHLVSYTSTFPSAILSSGYDRVFIQDDLSGVFALNSQLGSVEWINTDSHAQNNSSPMANQATPPVVTSMSIVSRGPDGRSVFALDRTTGAIQWITQVDEPDSIDQLFMAPGGKVIGMGNRVFGFDLRTGKPLFFWPERTNETFSFGQGLVTETEILWPTRDKIYFLKSDGSGESRPPLVRKDRSIGGNLALVNKFLVIARLNEIVVYSVGEAN